MGPDPDIYNVKHGFEALDAAGQRLRNSFDLDLLRHARRALLPLPFIDRPQKISTDVFPLFRRRRTTALAGRRVAVVASGGAGAAVALIGAARAFEEADLEPDLIAGCSGGGMFGSLWAAGLTAQEMADFVLSWQPEQYLDAQWLRLPRFALSALRGFSGAMKGEAVERLFDDRFAGLTAGEFAIPLSTIVYNTDRGLVDYFGTHTTPELSIGRLVRITIALPVFIESVEVRGHLYVDGGLIELLPTQPVIEHGPFDHVFGINFMLPTGLEPDDITGWHEKPMGIVRASRELQQAYHVEFARRAKRELGDSLSIIDAADPALCRGGWLYDLFIDRSRWPELIRTGYERTTEALAPWRSTRRSRRAPAITSSPEPRPTTGETMHTRRPDSLNRWEQRQAEAAAHEAAAIGGRAGDESIEPAQRPLVEAGEGVAEGFELAEEDLIEAAEHAPGWGDAGRNAFRPEEELSRSVYGDADHELSSEVMSDEVSKP